MGKAINWYIETQKTVNYYFDSDADLFAGFLAATSANSTVKANLSLAIKAYRQWENDEPFHGFLGQVIINLYRVLENRPLNGKKIESFRQALLGNDDAVVIDRWILRHYGKKNLSPKQYDTLADKIRLEAISANLSPSAYQALIWCQTKRKHGDVSRHTDKSFGDILRSRGVQSVFKF